MTAVRLAPLTADHWPQVRDIYAAGIATGNATVISATTHGVREHAIGGDYWGTHYVGARRY